MSRFIITVAVATVVHSTALIIAPPYEFGHSRLECLFYSAMSGIVFFPILLAVLLFPMRFVLRLLMPQSTARAQALIAVGISLAFIAGLHVVLFFNGWIPSPHIHGGILGSWLFASVFASAVIITFLWPIKPSAGVKRQ